MPILDPTQGAILVAIFTIFWGIIVESWFVSRWTIIFNVVPYIVMLATIELAEWAGFLGMYLLLSIIVALVPEHQNLKQLFGAKGYGSLALVLTVIGSANSNLVYLLWLIISAPVYVAWWRVRIWKENNAY
ncbi:hypothetical protein NWT39_12240 [Nitrososphaera viennensis]|uniref:Uncharacterized protein n=1 Tax=Nitrososphaera viennensis TaxID=1034015 RepID=A0A977NLT0_9ARCH|nr:hypothetical protein [Nitrososphaera viennensis]UVS68661.1 hypothetical protein NWT39_12240 [Nitrososphaera viennensis]